MMCLSCILNFPRKKKTNSSETSEGIASASKSKLKKLDSTKKLEGNKTAELIILEKLEVIDTKPVYHHTITDGTSTSKTEY
jgi:hypothetical protein